MIVLFVFLYVKSASRFSIENDADADAGNDRDQITKRFRQTQNWNACHAGVVSAISREPYEDRHGERD